jgi:hypothetical protein
MVRFSIGCGAVGVTRLSSSAIRMVKTAALISAKPEQQAAPMLGGPGGMGDLDFETAASFVSP